MPEDSDAGDQVAADVIDHACQLEKRRGERHLGEQKPARESTTVNKGTSRSTKKQGEARRKKNR